MVYHFQSFHFATNYEYRYGLALHRFVHIMHFIKREGPC